MPRQPEPPRLRQWRGDWYIFFTDWASMKPVRLRCESQGAFGKDGRKRLLDDFRVKDLLARADVLRQGHAFDFDRQVSEAVAWFKADVQARAQQRADHGGREGLGRKSARRLVESLDRLLAWLPSGLTTGRLDGHHLSRFLAETCAGLAAGTVNVHRRNLKTCLRWLALKRPRLFPDPDVFWPALKLARVQRQQALAFTPRQLQAFRKKLRADQRPLFDLLALTGMRLGEAEKLTWADVDLDRGRITIRASKTGYARVLPLVGAPEGPVAPGLLKALRARKKQGLPPAPHLLPKVWHAAGKIMPQALRRNFTSYAASLGVPAAVTAMWQGHTLTVAEDHYRQQVLSREQAASIEAAMGLA